jgi:N-methylhydantoinase B
MTNQVEPMVAPLDQITVEVIRNYLLATAREMNRNLLRTSFNTIVYEVHDFGLGIYDRAARLVAEAPGLATFTRGNDYALHKMVEHLGEENLHPGDLILLNYPYWSSHHVLDVLATAPIFTGERLVGFTAVKMHWLDLGQKDAGYVIDSTSIFQEGLIMPCLKIYKEGVLNTDLEDLIRFNSRMPDRVIGDMNAQISACRTGERRVQELVGRFGSETYELAVEEILNHGERIARARLERLPKGTWSAEDYLDDDGVDRGRLVKLRVTVTITDHEMVIDWSGSDPATAGPINLPIGATIGVCALCFKALTTPDTPANEGNFRPLRVEAPPGCVMHAVPPAPTFTLWTDMLAIEVVTRAVAESAPDLVPACSGGDISSMMGVGVRPDTGDLWVEATNEGVGLGGHSGGDGDNALMHLSEPGCRNNPIEVLETKAPLLIEEYALRQDSAGPGRYRGGLGIRRVYRFLAHASALTLVKKTKTRPWGMAGGLDGEPGLVVLRPGTDSEQRTGMVYESMEPSDVLVNYSGGGGGWGNPLERDPNHVLADVHAGYVSIAAARECYGVVIDPETMMLDPDATAELRGGV